MESDIPITSIERLLARHDRQFILDAYQAVLGRGPDAAGEAHYLACLRSGMHKLTILKQLRRSKEGQAFIPGVAGLDRAIRKHERATLPVVGALIRLWSGAEGNNATHRQLRALANEIGRLGHEQSSLAAMVWRSTQAAGAPQTSTAASTSAVPSEARPGTFPCIGVQRDGLAGYFQARIWNR